jgi:hypothetical protein
VPYKNILIKASDPYQEAVGTEASGQVDFLYWLPTVQNADEIPSA